MLTYPWKCTVLHCNHLGNTWKPLVLMTRHFDYCPSASEGDNQSVRSSAPVVSRCFPGGYNVKLYISRGRLPWWLLAFLHSDVSSNWWQFCHSFDWSILHGCFSLWTILGKWMGILRRRWDKNPLTEIDDGKGLRVYTKRVSKAPILGQSLTIHIECIEQDCWNHWSGETVTGHLDLLQLGKCLIDLIWMPSSEESGTVLGICTVSQVTTTTLATNNDNNDPFESTGSEDKKEVFITE